MYTKKYTELQDAKGNILYPMTDTDGVLMGGNPKVRLQEKIDQIDKDMEHLNSTVEGIATTGVAKLTSYAYDIDIELDNQTKVIIPYKYFDLRTDTLQVYLNGLALSSSSYEITNPVEIDGLIMEGYITLKTGVSVGSCVRLVILKNTPTGEEGSISGNVISVDSIPQNRVKGLESDLEGVNSQLNETMKYPILNTEVGVINKHYPYGDIRRYGAIGDGITDDSTAINNALNSGIKSVYAIRGNYAVKNSIIVPYDVNFDGNNSSFIPISGGTFLRSHIFLINDNGTDWIQQYPPFHPEFKNVFISNSNQLIDIKGVYTASQHKLYNIKTNMMYGTITKSVKYLDMVDIDTVDIGCPRGTGYHIDCGYIGDGLKVTRVHSHDWETSIGNINLIKVVGCNGGEISRIINGSIFISESSAIGLRNLHLERGTITTYNSAVTIENVFHWRTDKIPLIIDNDGDTSNRYNRAVNINNYIIIYYSGKYDNTTDLYDAKINNTIVNVNGLYRGILPKSGLVNQCKLFGTRITTNGTNEHEFNKHSSKNSIRSIIIYDRMSQQPFSKIVPSGSLYWLYNPTEDTSKDNGTIPLGTYYYRMQILIDIERKIGRADDLERQVTTSSDNSNILLITFGMNYLCENIARIYKGTTSGQYANYIDLPQVSGETQWDNGNGIGGFAWKTRTEGAMDSLNYYNKVTFDGDLVTCYGTAIPTVGTWKLGDRIINSSPTVGNPKSWVCTVAGSPGTWVNEGNL